MTRRRSEPGALVVAALVAGAVGCSASSSPPMLGNSPGSDAGGYDAQGTTDASTDASAAPEVGAHDSGQEAAQDSAADVVGTLDGGSDGTDAGFPPPPTALCGPIPPW